MKLKPPDRIVILSLFFFLWDFSGNAIAQKRPLIYEDLADIKNLSDLALSPDGEWLAFTMTAFDTGRRKNNSDIYMVSTSGGSYRQLTTHAARDMKPCWSPDGSMLSFLSDRSGKMQIHALSLNGGEAQQITSFDFNILNFLWSPEGAHFAFVTETESEVKDSLFSGCQADETSARMIDHLPVYRKNSWNEETVRHIFVTTPSADKIWDITPGEFDSPSRHLGSQRDFCFSPDGQQIAFVRNSDSLSTLSTNNDIFIVPVTGGTIRQITSNQANDNQPVYSPDGNYIAYRAMHKANFEADQYDLMVYHRKTGSKRNLSDGFDLDVQEIAWNSESDKIFFTVQDQGRYALFCAELESGKIKGLVHKGCNSNPVINPFYERLYFLKSTIKTPTEIYSCDFKGENAFQLTFANSELLEKLEMNPLEDFWFPSFDGKIVHGFLLKPPFFDPALTYPGLLLIHGGPQQAWRDRFQSRWNSQMFAAQGYVVIHINIRGSKGYGHEFSDDVSGDWGGAAYKDLMTGLDYILKKYSYIKSDRLAAAGTGFGGFMVNWIAGHTDRFKCLVTEAGIANPFSFYGTTDHLWFPEWEFEKSPYENSRAYDRWFPLKFAKNFKSPTLVIHGALDHRITVDQSLQMFTALQRQSVPSRLLCFPDEGRCIKNPKNIEIWWKVVFDWLRLWTKDAGGV